MFTVDITEDDEGRSAAKAVAALRRFPVVAGKKLQRAVNRERENHKYQNRTHAAETNTLMLTKTTPSVMSLDAEIVAEMAVEYASYLQGGWSRFEQYIEGAFVSIDTDFNALR